MQAAKNAVKRAIQARGQKLANFAARKITLAAEEYVAGHRELIAEAKETVLSWHLRAALATSFGTHQSGSLTTMAAISHVFTINYVAEMLGEDQEWLWQLQVDMFAEDSCLRVYGVGDDGVPAFTDYGIEALASASRYFQRLVDTGNDCIQCLGYAPP